MNKDNNKIFLKRVSPKPYPTKGIYGEDNLKSPATHACIYLNEAEFYEVNVWDLRKNSTWSESSYGQLHKYIKLLSIEEAKKWLVENYGGKWCKEQ